MMPCRGRLRRRSSLFGIWSGRRSSLRWPCRRSGLQGVGSAIEGAGQKLMPVTAAEAIGCRSPPLYLDFTFSKIQIGGKGTWHITTDVRTGQNLIPTGGFTDGRATSGNTLRDWRTPNRRQSRIPLRTYWTRLRTKHCKELLFTCRTRHIADTEYLWAFALITFTFVLRSAPLVLKCRSPS